MATAPKLKSLLQVLGYIRVVRPGSILGPQQLYLKQRQSQMWALGGVSRSFIAPASTTVHPDGSGTSTSFFRGMLRNLSISSSSSTSSRTVTSGATPDGHEQHSPASGEEMQREAAQGARARVGLAATRSPSVGESQSVLSKPPPELRMRQMLLHGKQETPDARAQVRRQSSQAHSVYASMGSREGGLARTPAAVSNTAGAGVHTVVRTVSSSGQPRKVMQLDATDRMAYAHTVRTVAANGQPRKVMQMDPVDNAAHARAERRLGAFRSERRH
jgi:hypothetical protein